jgi:hypothetical protein
MHSLHWHHVELHAVTNNLYTPQANLSVYQK